MLKVAREKQHVMYNGSPIRLSADFSAEIFQARMQQDDVFKVLNIKQLSTKTLYLPKLSFKNEAEIKTFQGKQKLSESVITRPTPKEILKEILQVEIKGCETVT